METQREEKEKQELRMLREQRDLLTKLVEQQKQVNNKPCVRLHMAAVYTHTISPQLIKVTSVVVGKQSLHKSHTAMHIQEIFLSAPGMWIFAP